MLLNPHSVINRPQEADEEQLRTADDAAATVTARLGQLASERAALEEHRDATARELQSAKAALEARRAELSKLQGEARSSKCAPGSCIQVIGTVCMRGRVSFLAGQAYDGYAGTQLHCVA